MLVVTLSWAAACAALTGCQTTHRETWPNGQVKREGKLQGNDQVGEWTFWYESGRLRAKGGYEHDVQTGAWTYWHDNGNKEMEGVYRAERREDLWRYFHRNGNPRAQGRFAHGRESGPWTFWNSDGQIAQQGDYSDGRPALRWTSFRGNGQKQSEGCWLDGRRVGTWQFWDETGKPFTKSFTMPDDVKLVRETWEDGKLRREGFVKGGRPVGRWATLHRNGRRRTSGDFVDGVASGTWMAWDAGGELLAVGNVHDGNPTGEWRVWSHGLETAWNADEVAPPPVAADWSADDVTGSEAPDQVVRTWLAEAASEVEAQTAVAAAPAAGEAPPPALEAAAETKAEVPVKDQPYTKREEEEYGRYVDNYGLHPKSIAATGGRYGRPRSGAAATKGDTARSEAMVGKPLPVEQFRCTDGRELKLADLRGKKVLVVVLRGYGSGVCVYCDAQTRALASPEVMKSIADLGCEVVLVYPGPENGWQAFLAKYQRAGSDAPPFPCLFDPELALVRSLSIEGNQAIPSTLLLDGTGVVRFAYVGTTIDDRPPAKRLLDEIKKL
jgi:antitoxin component YwqK of YwqJK toxin-antitoxin module/peroxiredoxin